MNKLEFRMDIPAVTREYTPGSPQAKLIRRECSPTHQQIIELRAQPCLLEQTQFFPPSVPPIRKLAQALASSTRGQTEEARRTAIPQWLEQKPYYRKLIRMKKQRVMSHMKQQNPRKTTKWSGDKQSSRNRSHRIMIVKMIHDLRKRMQRMQEMFAKNLEL